MHTVRNSLGALLIAVLLPIGAISQQAAPPPNSEMQHKQNGAEQQQTVGTVGTIIQSRSTNTPGFRIVIHEDGSATQEISEFRFTTPSAPAQPREYPPGTVDTKTLNHLLAKIGDVSTIPTGHCAKSVSFGTQTQISYKGKISGDLQCVRGPATGGDQALLQASQQLSQFVQEVVKRMKVPVGHMGTVFK